MTCCFFECSLVFPEPVNLDKDHPDEDSLLGYEKDEDYRRYKCIFSLPRLYTALCRLKRWTGNKLTSKGCRKCCWCIFLILFMLVMLVFLVLFVALPLVFKSSIAIQRSLIFDPVTGPHALYETIDWVENYDRYNNWGHPRYNKTFSNKYVEVNNGTRLGVWNLTATFVKTYDISYSTKQYARGHVLYFHSENGDRRKYKDFYTGLSPYFNVTAFDYRSYGDSSKAELVEKGLVDDSVQLYKWLQGRTDQNIYVMAHELGAAVATHVVAELRKEGVVPTGLVLIRPFSSLSDEIKEWFWPLGKIFSWMPWYDAVITDTLKQNDLAFETRKYIPHIDCPIMIVGKPYDDESSEEIAEVASKRDVSTQGTVILRRTWWYPTDQYGMDFKYFRSFADDCEDFKKNKGKL